MPRNDRGGKKVAGLRIACISDQRLPNTVATSDQVVNMAESFAAAGAEVDLIVPRRGFFSDDSVLRRQICDHYGVEGRFGLRSVPDLHLPANGLRKVAHGIAGAFSARFSSYDIIHTRNALPAFLGVGLGVPVVFETYHLVDRHRPRLARRLAGLSHKPGLAAIVAHSAPSRDSLVSSGVVPEKVLVAHNGFSPARMEPALNTADARRLLGWDEKEKIVCYTGRIGADKGSLFVLEMAQRTPAVSYVLVGPSEGGGAGDLLGQARERGLRNVSCLPPVAPGRIAPFLYGADILLIPPTAGPLVHHGRTVLPIKTYLYMAAGRPIVAPLLADTEGVLTDANSLRVVPDDAEAAAGAILRLASDTALGAALAGQARKDVLSYTWEMRARRILDCLSGAARRAPS